jgi:CheY-like chemotaxis protein
MKVLLAEDLEGSRRVLRAMIERLGHEVIEAQNGREAVMSVVDNHPDIVLMDLSMPEVDGLTAAAAVRKLSHCSRCEQLPVIAISAYPETLSAEKALKAGCNGYLRKPVDLADLSGVIERFGRRG